MAWQEIRTANDSRSTNVRIVDAVVSHCETRGKDSVVGAVRAVGGSLPGGPRTPAARPPAALARGRAEAVDAAQYRRDVQAAGSTPRETPDRPPSGPRVAGAAVVAPSGAVPGARPAGAC
ncbi:hypothetical protein GCM10025734_25370 [Kitasatospora paranensis]